MSITVAFESVCLNPAIFGGHGYGGFYRTSQILELLSEAGVDVYALDHHGGFN